MHFLEEFEILKNKRASHVGMILSFVIFITFLVFLFSVTQPVTQRDSDKQDLLDYLKIELIQKISLDMTSTSAKVFARQSCIKIDIIEGTEGLGTVVKDEDENILDSYVLNNKLIIKTQNKDFFKIYYAESFENNALSDCREVNYNLGLTRTEEYVFEEEIINLTNFINESVDNYEKIKEELKIPFGSEFGFSFENSKGEIILTNEKEIQADIYSEEIPIQYINSEANIKSGFLTIKVW